MLTLLLVPYIIILYQIVLERGTVSLSLVVLSYANDRFYKFVKVYRSQCCKT